jgi:hypothetical protein
MVVSDVLRKGYNKMNGIQEKKMCTITLIGRPCQGLTGGKKC